MNPYDVKRAHLFVLLCCIAEREKMRLQAEVERLRKELESFDPSFFEEIEDLKYNYNLEVKKNLLLEEQLRSLCDRFGVKDKSTSGSIS